MAQENKSKVSILTNGIIKENPFLRLVLGTCSILAVTTAVSSALGMGAAFTFVLVCSNIMISLLRKVIPGKVHLPCYIVIIASFVTIVQMFMQAYMESLYNALGVFLLSNGLSKSFNILCFVSFSERLACSVGIFQSIRIDYKGFRRHILWQR